MLSRLRRRVAALFENDGGVPPCCEAVLRSLEAMVFSLTRPAAFPREVRRALRMITAARARRVELFEELLTVCRNTSAEFFEPGTPLPDAIRAHHFAHYSQLSGEEYEQRIWEIITVIRRTAYFWLRTRPVSFTSQ